MAKLAGLKEPRGLRTPGQKNLQFGIISPCIGCKNSYPIVDSDTMFIKTGSPSPICPRKVVETFEPESPFATPLELVGNPINPVFSGTILYTWIALTTKNEVAKNPELDTERIICEKKPYILFLPESYYNSTGMPEQGDELLVLDGTIQYDNILYGGVAFPAQFSKVFPALARGVNGITSGCSGK